MPRSNRNINKNIRDFTISATLWTADHHLRWANLSAVTISAPIRHIRKSPYPLAKSWNHHIRADMVDMVTPYPPATLYTMWCGCIPMPNGTTYDKNVRNRTYTFISCQEKKSGWKILFFRGEILISKLRVWPWFCRFWLLVGDGFI